jgi:Gpi18-like mannosyltransferase
VLVWAAIVVAARHAVVRRPTIVQHLGRSFVAAYQSTAVRTAVMIVIVTRAVVFVAGYLAVITFGYAPNAEPFRNFASEVMSLPLRWDTGWYLQIAREGYHVAEGADAALQQNIVFFPAYPMLVRVLGLIGGNTLASFVVAGTIASLVLFGWALTYFYWLAREERMTDDQSAAALWLIAAFPFALFYGAIYTESLYLVGALGTFYHFKRREYGRAGLWGLVVGLTRPNGFFICLPLALLMLAPSLQAPADRRRRRGLAPAAIAAASMPALGVLIYSLFLAQLTGNPLAWAAGHAAWGRHYEGLATVVTDRYTLISHVGVIGYITELPYDFLNALGVSLVLASVWPVARRFGIAYAVFILINILPPLADGGLMSAGRFSSVLFPAFLWLAAAVPIRQRAGWMTTFAALQAFNAALFYTWRPLY